MVEEQPMCPICEVGVLAPTIYSDTFQPHGVDLVVSGLEGYDCLVCGADPIFEDQIRRNHARVMDAKRRADRRAMGEETQAQRERRCAPSAQSIDSNSD